MASIDQSDHSSGSSVGHLSDPQQRVVVEVEFVNASLDAMDADQKAGLWQWVDETSVDARLRQSLLDNGVRIGVVSNQPRFQSRLEASTIQPDAVEEFLSEAAVASEVSHGRQRIPMRFGRRYELALRQPFEGTHTALIRTEGETIGRTLSNAQYFFALTASQADVAQQIRLRIRPEIQYGAAKQKWVSSDSAIRIDTRRETWSLEMLDIDVAAVAGDTIVVAPDTPTHGLASKMLTGNGTDQHEQQLVVLIHVTQIPSPADQLAADLR